MKKLAKYNDVEIENIDSANAFEEIPNYLESYLELKHNSQLVVKTKT
jgi:hypothetical protein